MSAADITHATEVAAAAIQAQHIVYEIRAKRMTTMHAWLAFVELAASHGWKSASCRAFVTELAKIR